MGWGLPGKIDGIVTIGKNKLGVKILELEGGGGHWSKKLTIFAKIKHDYVPVLRIDIWADNSGDCDSIDNTRKLTKENGEYFTKKEFLSYLSYPLCVGYDSKLKVLESTKEWYDITVNTSGTRTQNKRSSKIESFSDVKKFVFSDLEDKYLLENEQRLP